jgi:imidazolonepropionase-like amidohydrolase
MRSKATRPALAGLAGAVFFPLAAAAAGAAPRQEAAPTTFVLRAEHLVVRPGQVRENASVLVRDGRIVRVGGSDLALPEGAVEITGKVVCAGFIDPWSALGLESGTLGDTRVEEAARTVDGLDLYSADHLREEALRAGVTLARVQAGWQGATGGLGAVVRLDPEVDELDHAVVLADADLGTALGLSVDQGSQFVRRPDGSFEVISGERPVDVFDRVSAVDKLVSNLEAGRAYRRAELEYEHELAKWQEAIAEKTEELEKDFKKAKKDRDKDLEKAKEDGKELKEKKYKEDRKPRAPKVDAGKAVLARVAEGELPLVVEVHRIGELRNLLDATEGFSRLRMIIAGGTEAGPLASELAERGIPVIVWPSLRGTAAGDEFSGSDLGLAATLRAAGVEVLLGTGGRDGRATRDLPLLAQLAIGHGLEAEDAFHALTLGAARAFDVADRLGSVEVGKEADLLVLDGMPLEAATRTQFVLCGGRLAVSPN